MLRKYFRRLPVSPVPGFGIPGTETGSAGALKIKNRNLVQLFTITLRVHIVDTTPRAQKARPSEIICAFMLPSKRTTHVKPNLRK